MSESVRDSLIMYKMHQRTDGRFTPHLLYDIESALNSPEHPSTEISDFVYQYIVMVSVDELK